MPNHELRTLINESKIATANQASGATLIPGFVISAQALQSSAASRGQSPAASEQTPPPQRFPHGPSSNPACVTEAIAASSTVLLSKHPRLARDQLAGPPAQTTPAAAARGTQRRQSWAAPDAIELSVRSGSSSMDVELFAGVSSRRLSVLPAAAWSEDESDSAAALRYGSLRETGPVAESCGRASIIFGSLGRVSQSRPSALEEQQRQPIRRSVLWTTVEETATKRHLMAGTALVFAHLALKNVIPLKLLNEEMAKTARHLRLMFCFAPSKTGAEEAALAVPCNASPQTATRLAGTSS